MTVCNCGFVDIPEGFHVVSWYWQEHSVKACTLQLPNVKCWCGLLRSEHIEGHREEENK